LEYLHNHNSPYKLDPIIFYWTLFI